MATVRQILRYLALLLILSGFLLEILGIWAAALYPLRRRLPWSPFTIVSLGGICLVSGILCLVLTTSMN